MKLTPEQSNSLAKKISELIEGESGVLVFTDNAKGPMTKIHIQGINITPDGVMFLLGAALNGYGKGKGQ